MRAWFTKDRKQSYLDIEDQMDGVHVGCPVCDPDPCDPENHEREVIDFFRRLEERALDILPPTGRMQVR